MQQGAQAPVIIVTGAGQGVGKATAEAIVRAGGHVLAVIRSAATATALAQTLGDAALVLTRDVTMPDAAETAMKAGLDRWGHIDGLVNNAGTIEPIGALAETDAAQWEHAIATNLIAPSRFIRAFIAQGERQATRRIVNLSTGAAHQALEGWSAYCAGKAALAMLTRAIALDHAKDHIRVFGLLPGLVDTGMQETIRASGINEVSRIPRSSLRPAEEPARAVQYLLSGAADDLAGGEIDIRNADFRSRAGLPAL
ncbi:SDR family NAD(P)-dependent oxidoreductase [Taklimakanibacter deserti]|uniref:SDR family NAD(P)-dependent oxidoreductase n=1 Tax=Taklimakanibacter deserti TaxID=2267839 RepID=UPI000E65D43C